MPFFHAIPIKDLSEILQAERKDIKHRQSDKTKPLK